MWGLDKYLRPFADEDAGEVPMAWVSTTMEGAISATMQDLYEWEDTRPDPGPGNKVFGDGPYVIKARLGDLAVVAMGGIARLHPETGAVEEFRPMRMGVKRFLFGISGERIENADIELNVPLSQVASLRFDQPPAEVDGGNPNTLSVRPFIVFDAEGVWPLWEYVGYAGEPMEAGFDMVNMPALVHGLEGASFTVSSSLDTRDFNGVGMPFAEVYLRDITSLAEEIDVGPWVGIPRLTLPEPGGEHPVGPDHRLEWTYDGGSDPPTGQFLMLLEFTADGAALKWQMFLPGHLSDVTFPALDGVINPGAPGAALFRSVWVEGLDIDAFEYNDYLSVDSFRAWSMDYDVLLFPLD